MTKKIVVPGEILTTEKKRIGSHVFIEDGKIRAECLGLYDDEALNCSVVPLQGKYLPKRGDIIIGIVKGEQYAGYLVDINSFYNTFVLREDAFRPLAKGDMISARIASVNEVNEVKLEDIRMLYGGHLLRVSPVKVPRLIGKNGSMIELLKKGTNSKIIVGRNGWIWISSENEPLLKKLIYFVEENAHRPNLTNAVQSLLEKNKKK